MNRSVFFHAMAEQELNEASGYFSEVRAALGHGFLDEVQRSLDQIIQYPEAAPLVNQLVRRKLLWRFPHSIMYSVTPESIRILAIAHQKRRPLYWRGRK